MTAVEHGRADSCSLPATPVSRRDSLTEYRKDLQGLRGIAVIAVVTFHAFPHWLPGGFLGVDVFFVLSGYLITGLLLRELESTGRINLAGFWARRARRLLPASTLTLVVVCLTSLWILTPTALVELGSAARAAALLYSNLWFANQSTDYFVADVGTSPIQNFWSLSVEEQYYLAIPIVLVLGWTVGRKWVSPRRLVALLALAIAVPSLALACVRAMSAPDPAHYFGSFDRFWELAVGSLLAAFIAKYGPPRRGAALLVGWVGLLFVAESFVYYDTSIATPGPATLVPIIGTVCLIYAGSLQGGAAGVGRALRVGPLTRMGDISYSLYLWHWPVLVLAGTALGGLDDWQRLASVGVALVLAVLSHRWVENPARRSKWLAATPWRGLGLCAALVAAVLAVAAIAGSPAGVWALRHGGDTAAMPRIRPEPARALYDSTQAHRAGCQGSYPDLVPGANCLFAAKGSASTWVLWGDSHAIQHFPAVESAASQQGAQLLAMGKAACLPAGVTLWAARLQRPYTECDQWQANALARIGQLDPATTTVVTTGRHDYLVAENGWRASAERSSELIESAWRARIKELLSAGYRVVLIRDTPKTGTNTAACVAMNLGEPQLCDFARPEESRGPSWEQSMVGGLPVGIVDLNDTVCEAQTCPAVVDGVLRWRDDDHLSATFSALTAERFAARMREIAPK